MIFYLNFQFAKPGYSTCDPTCLLPHPSRNPFSESESGQRACFNSQESRGSHIAEPLPKASQLPDFPVPLLQTGNSRRCGLLGGYCQAALWLGQRPESLGEEGGLLTMNHGGGLSLVKALGQTLPWAMNLSLTPEGCTYQPAPCHSPGWTTN
jgi:hypothetical protein